jgi:hypothetical protein
MPLGNGVMQRREALVICRVERAAIAKKQKHHGNRTSSGGAMDRILATAVTHPSGSFVLDKDLGCLEVLLGSYKV